MSNNGTVPYSDGKVTVTRIFDFAMAHNLQYHNSKCRFFHGHNYKLHVTVSAPSSSSLEHTDNRSELGMVIDFTKLKQIVNDLIVNVYDHSLMVWTDDVENECCTLNKGIKKLIKDCTEEELTDSNIFVVDFRPTAENMCVFFYQKLAPVLKSTLNVILESIRLYETDNSYAEYIPETRKETPIVEDPIREIDKEDDHLLYVDEIFGPTIQGEGSYCGTPCYFIRLNGCDQKPACSWCDTMRSYVHNEKSLMSVDQIIGELANLSQESSKLPVNRFIITGGNPCIQDCKELIFRLRKHFSDSGSGIPAIINVETQGTLFPTWLKDVDHIVVSPKPPSATKTDKGQSYAELMKFFTNLNNIDSTFEIKIVVFNDADMNYAIQVIKDMQWLTKYHNIANGRGNKVTFTIQLGTTKNLFQGRYTVDDIFRALGRESHSLDPMIINNLRILPQVHTMLNVR